MNIFKETSWKWWEVKLLAWIGIALTVAVITTWPEVVTWLNKWDYTYLTAWVVFAAVWTYTAVTWFKQQ